MDCKSLKAQLEKNILPPLPLILKYKNSGEIICNHYIDAICNITNKIKLYISYEDLSSSLFHANLDYQMVLKTDTLDKEINEEIIVLCKDIDKNFKNKYNIVNIPELEEWQLKDYIKLLLPDFKESNIDYLLSVYKNNYFGLMNEIDKFKILNKYNQENIFENLKFSGYYESYRENDIFDIVNNIKSKQIDKLKENILYSVPDFARLVSILYPNFKELAAVKLTPNASPESLGMKSNKFYAIRHFINYYTQEQLYNILSFLSSIDTKIKKGILPADICTDYIITHVLTC